MKKWLAGGVALGFLMLALYWGQGGGNPTLQDSDQVSRSQSGIEHSDSSQDKGAAKVFEREPDLQERVRRDPAAAREKLGTYWSNLSKQAHRLAGTENPKKSLRLANETMNEIQSCVQRLAPVREGWVTRGMLKYCVGSAQALAETFEELEPRLETIRASLDERIIKEFFKMEAEQGLE